MSCIGCGCATFLVLALGILAYVFYDDIAAWVSREAAQQVVFKPDEALTTAEKVIPGAGQGMQGITGWHLGQAVRVVILGRAVPGSKWAFFVGLAEASEEVVPREELRQRILASQAGEVTDQNSEKLSLPVQGVTRDVLRQVSRPGQEGGTPWVSYVVDLEGPEGKPVLCVVFGPQGALDENAAKAYLKALPPPADPRPPAPELKGAFTVNGLQLGWTEAQVVERLGQPAQQKELATEKGMGKKLFYRHPEKLQIALDPAGTVEDIQGTQLLMEGRVMVQIGQPESEALGRIGESTHRASVAGPDDTRIYKGAGGFYSLTTSRGRVEAVGLHRADFR
ncbi:MAG: hypothetical protein HY319_11080 [Armatimonadetes bacterium]|nr:hypothetical protein [Armatimonadota bacterium]